MVRRDWKLDQLSHIDVLAHLPKRRLRELSSITTLLRFPAGKVLWQQGDTAREAFLLLEGSLQLSWGDTPLQQVGPGVIVGGVGLPERAPRVATSTTLTEVEALVMSRGEYRQMLALFPEIAHRVEEGHRRRFSALRMAAPAVP